MAEGFKLVAHLRSDSDVQGAVDLLAACGGDADWEQTQALLAERFARSSVPSGKHQALTVVCDEHTAFLLTACHCVCIQPGSNPSNTVPVP